MHFSISTKPHSTIHDFVEHWSQFYDYTHEHLYTSNINKKPLTQDSLHKLFVWKNGGPISNLKLKSINAHYPLEYRGDLKDFLTVFLGGGPIWNIFYMHINDQTWPIFDQHTYRSMMYIKNNLVEELPTKKQTVYDIYTNTYIPFFNFLKQNCDFTNRKLDKALFVFGKFLKTAKPFIRVTI